MPYRIGKRFSFDAAHSLAELGSAHKCSRLHGHTYTVEIVLEAERLAAPGFVDDFAEFGPLKSYIDDSFDHRNLNDVLDIPPTSEAIAFHLAQWYLQQMDAQMNGRLVGVRVAETPTSWAEYVT